MVTVRQIQSVLGGATRHLTVLAPTMAALTAGCLALAELAVLPTVTVLCRMAVTDGKILVAAQNAWEWAAGRTMLASSPPA